MFDNPDPNLRLSASEMRGDALGRFPFKDIVDSKFRLAELDTAFKKASERSVLRAAIVP